MNKKLIPLYILNEGGKVPITPLMKLVFLVQKEKIEEEPYEYTPERYGPFSKVLFDDIQRLLNEGFIKIIEEESKIFPDPIEYYTLTKKGRKTLEVAMDDPEHEYLNDINIDEEFFDDLWELIDYIYYRYPRSFSEDHTIPIGKPKSKYWREQ